MRGIGSVGLVKRRVRGGGGKRGWKGDKSLCGMMLRNEEKNGEMLRVQGSRIEQNWKMGGCWEGVGYWSTVRGGGGGGE